MNKKLVSYACVFICLIFNVVIARAALVDKNAKPVADISIILSLGDATNAAGFSDDMKKWYSHQLKDAMQKRMPEIFSANQVLVNSTTVLEGPPLGEKWPENSDAVAGASYVLVLTPKYFTSKPTIFFEAVLWDVQEKKMVWNSFPEMAVFVSQPLLRTQLLTAKILSALKNDHLITLKTNDPIDLRGEPITTYFRFTDDR